MKLKQFDLGEGVYISLFIIMCFFSCQNSRDREHELRMGEQKIKAFSEIKKIDELKKAIKLEKEFEK